MLNDRTGKSRLDRRQCRPTSHTSILAIPIPGLSTRFAAQRQVLRKIASYIVKRSTADSRTMPNRRGRVRITRKIVLPGRSSR